MKTALIAGVVLGLSVAGWTLLMGVTGWYKDPAMANAFFAVVSIEFVIVLVTLAKTRRERGYGGQLAVGTVLSLVGAVIIFGNSLLFTTVLFPRYFEELREVQAQLLREEGKSQDEIERAIEESASTQTPLGSAFAGFVGTTVTGVVASALGAIFLRKKEG